MYYPNLLPHNSLPHNSLPDDWPSLLMPVHWNLPFGIPFYFLRIPNTLLSSEQCVRTKHLLALGRDPLISDHFHPGAVVIAVHIGVRIGLGGGALAVVGREAWVIKERN